MAANGATTAQVSASASSVQLVAANALRAGEKGVPSLVVANDSSAVLYILLGLGTASAGNYTYALAGNGGGVAGTLTLSGYRGAAQGCWASATGQAQVTELL